LFHSRKVQNAQFTAISYQPSAISYQN